MMVMLEKLIITNIVALAFVGAIFVCVCEAVSYMRAWIFVQILMLLSVSLLVLIVVAVWK